VSIVSGLRNGVRSALRSGVNPSDAGSLAGVTRDATNGVYYPATGAENASLIGAAGLTFTAAALWTLQEASGNAADSIGAFTLTAAGTLAYQQAVAGLSRKGILTTQGVAGTLSSTAAGLPDIGTASCLLWFDVAAPVSVSTTRALGQLGALFGSAASAQFITATNKKLNFACDPNNAAGADDATTTVRSVGIKIDRTGAVAAIYTAAEKLAPALTATPAGKLVMLGGDNLVSFLPDAQAYVWASLYNGANAEWSDAQARSFLSTRGYTVAW